MSIVKKDSSNHDEDKILQIIHEILDEQDPRLFTLALELAASTSDITVVQAKEIVECVQDMSVLFKLNNILSGPVRFDIWESRSDESEHVVLIHDDDKIANILGDASRLTTNKRKANNNKRATSTTAKKGTPSTAAKRKDARKAKSNSTAAEDAKKKTSVATKRQLSVATAEANNKNKKVRVEETSDDDDDDDEEEEEEEEGQQVPMHFPIPAAKEMRLTQFTFEEHGARIHKPCQGEWESVKRCMSSLHHKIVPSRDSYPGPYWFVWNNNDHPLIVDHPDMKGSYFFGVVHKRNRTSGEEVVRWARRGLIKKLKPSTVKRITANLGKYDSMSEENFSTPVIHDLWNHAVSKFRFGKDP